MNRCDLVPPAARPSRRAFRLLLLSLAVTAGLAGCSSPQVRSQKEEETDKERYLVKTIGEVSTFGGAEPVPVTTIGLVEGLEGTGSAAPAGDQRQMVETELKRQKVPNIKQILSSNDYSLVVVSGVIPAGAKKGDKIDLEVSLTQGSRTTSLRGGYLRHCALFNYDFASRMNPNAADNNTALRGHPLVKAEGPLLTGGGAEGGSEKSARIWAGGVCQIDREFLVLLNANQQFARVANNVATRINNAFQGTVSMTPGHELAVARNNTIITLNVPPQYKLNLPRFLRVVRMVPLEELPAAENRQRLPYRQQLHEDLLDPARAIITALRLEALGKETAPLLRDGLKSAHPLVRFCAAESLAYLGEPSCAEELARVIRQQPYLRAFALTALASLDESVSSVKLKELIAEDLEDETRYGSFRALWTLDETDEAVKGELLNETFWLHQVAKGSKPLIHVSTSHRAEIVLFGETPKLIPPCSLLAGEYAITASRDAQRCTITHVSLHSQDGGPSQGRCSMDLPEIIRALAAAGATYPEVIEMLRQADSCRNLTCRVRNDALPQQVPVEQLAQAGRQKLDIDSATEVQIIKPDVNLGKPNLDENDSGHQSAALDRDARVLQQEKRTREQRQTAERE